MKTNQNQRLKSKCSWLCMLEERCGLTPTLLCFTKSQIFTRHVCEATVYKKTDTGPGYDNIKTKDNLVEFVSGPDSSKLSTSTLNILLSVT